MFRHILLAILIVSSYNSIIQIPKQLENPLNSANASFSPIFRLSQNFLYSLTFPSSINPSITNSLFFTLVSNNQTCQALFCYYGWIHNYTLNGKNFEGYTMGSTDNSMVFLIKGYTNRTYSVTIDRSQSLQKIAILDICIKVSNPLASQISSLNPFNKQPKSQQLAVYKFVLLVQALKNQELKNSLNLQQFNGGIFANNTVIGINKTKSEKYQSFTDILAVDNTNNIVLARKTVGIAKIKASQSLSIQLKNQELKNSLNLQQFNGGIFANNTVIGINKTKSEKYQSFTDILAVDNTNNIVLARKTVGIAKIKASQSLSIQLKMKSSSKFSNIQTVKNLLWSLSSQPKNSIYLPILPQHLQLSQVKMNFP